MFHNNDFHDNNKEAEEIKQRPPFTFNEWLKYNKLDDWPLDTSVEVIDSELHLAPDHVGLGSIDNIYSELKQRARIFS